MSRQNRVNWRRGLLAAASMFAWHSGFNGAASAQEGSSGQQPRPGPPSIPPFTPTPAPARTPDSAEPRDPPGTIIVIGNRSIIASLKDLEVEQEYDEQDVASYGANSIGDVIDAIREEGGDEDPTILVNGRPVADRNDIADLPPEAIARVETLPRGAAQRVNGAPGERAYNIVLKQQVRTAILTSSGEFATQGGWENLRGEAQATLVRGQNRINLTARGGRSGKLLESERAFIPRNERTPFAPTGNIVPASGTEIDPLLSTLAGKPVTVLGLPAGVTNPTLAGLLPGANAAAPAGTARFRTLRGTSSPLEISLSGNRELEESLSLSFNGRLSWQSTDTLNGLPSARFLIPATNPFSPFSRTVGLALNDPSRPLSGSFRSNTQALSTTLNTQFGTWRASLNTRYDRRASTSRFQSSGNLGAAATIGAGTNPFAAGLAATIPVTERFSTSRTETIRVEAEAEGSVAQLWAGPLLARARAGVGRTGYDAVSDTDTREFRRRDLAVGAGFTLPLTGSDPAFLLALGNSDLAADVGWTDLGVFGSLERRSLALNWQVREWLRLVGTLGYEERAAVPELLSAPSVIVPNVPFFDPVTGESVEVTAIYGGIAGNANQGTRTRSVALTVTPSKRYNLQLDATYTDEGLSNQLGSLPDASAAIIAAFPERFVRDPSGTLILVDSRSVNFAKETSERLRLGLRFMLPLQATAPPAPRVRGAPRPPRPKVARLQFNASHTILLASETTIRAGLPTIDLLRGGAIGIGGGRQRHISNGSIAATVGASGVRLDYNRRGGSVLTFGTAAAPDRLTFGALSTFDLKAYADLGQHFPQWSVAKGTRISLTIDNIANARQRVVNSLGEVPQAYQPLRRDPLGRTVTVELRKSF